jgi:hypothetical protein
MNIKDWLTNQLFAKQAFARLQSNELRKGELQPLAKSLKSQSFSLLVIELENQIKKEWGAASEPVKRESLHSELRSLKRLRKKVNALAQEFDREN